jgi:mRNA interferase RelE/StbE
MLELEYTKDAERFVMALPKKQAGQIVRRVELLRSEPHAQDTKQLQGYAPLRRADIGEYRIIYFIDKTVLRIVMIGKRNDDDIYRKLSRKLRG